VASGLRYFLVVSPLVLELDVLHAGVGPGVGLELVEPAGWARWKVRTSTPGARTPHTDRRSPRSQVESVPPGPRCRPRSSGRHEASSAPSPLNSVAMPSPPPLRGCRTGRPSLDDMDPGPSSSAGANAPNRHVPERVALLLVESDDETTSRDRRANHSLHAATPTLGLRVLRPCPGRPDRESRTGRSAEARSRCRRSLSSDEGASSRGRAMSTTGEHENIRERHAADRRAPADAARPGPFRQILPQNGDPHHGGLNPHRSAGAREPNRLTLAHENL